MSAFLVALLITASTAFAVDTGGPARVIDEEALAKRELAQAHAHADKILAFYARLPAAERIKVDAALKESIISIEEWASRNADTEFLCLGERHGPGPREFLETRFLPVYKPDALLLEDGPNIVSGFLTRAQNGESGLTLKYADISGVMRAAEKVGATVIGVDVEPGEAVAREDQIFNRVLAANKTAKKSVALYGALHCSTVYGMFYSRMLARSDRSSSMKSITTESWNKPEAAGLQRFLSKLGYAATDFAIVDPTRFAESPLGKWFPKALYALRGYDGAFVIP